MNRRPKILKPAELTKGPGGTIKAWYKLTDVTLDEKNARQHEDKDIDAIAASIEEYGQQKPIVIDGDGIVRAGNGTCLALERKKDELVWGVQSKLRGAEAVAYALADNRTAGLSKWDFEFVANTLKWLQDEGQDVSKIGWSDDEIKLLIENITANEVEFKEYDESVEEEVQYHECPQCGHKWPR